MIDLYDIAASLTEAVNPFTRAILRVYEGEDDSINRNPIYRDVSVDIEVQALSGSDLQHLENLSQTSEMRAVYIRGPLSPLSAPRKLGGDLLIFDGRTWLVTQLLEEWGNDSWRKVIVILQNDPAPT